MKFQFCPRCHKAVFTKMNFDRIKFTKASAGITIKCGDPNCKGVVRIKPRPDQLVEANDS